MTEQNEFKAYGMNMTTMTLAYGGFLILWGLALFLISGHKTAAMPAVIGLPILLAGALAWKVPSKRKIWMHIAVIFGLLNFAVGTYMIIKASGSEGDSSRISEKLHPSSCSLRQVCSIPRPVYSPSSGLERTHQLLERWVSVRCHRDDRGLRLLSRRKEAGEGPTPRQVHIPRIPMGRST